MKVLCLGGNICLGARSPRGWPEHLWQVSGAHVVNGATSGARLIDVLRSIPRQPGEGWDLVVVQTGAYDARGGGTPPVEFASLLEQTVDAVNIRWPEARVILCTPTPIAPSCTVSGFNRAARRWVTRVTPLVYDVADGQCEVVVLHDLDLNLLPDGVHPSSAGSFEIATRVAANLARTAS